MKTTFDRSERQEQRFILEKIYPDYDPRHHDVFVYRFNSEQDKFNLDQYMINRGIKDKAINNDK